MTKVKVSKEVAEVLVRIKELSKGDLNASFQRLGGILYNQNAVVSSEVYSVMRTHKEEWELFNALQFGYEVEQAPAEELLSYYEFHTQKAEQDDCVNYHDGILQGVEKSLGVLEITIKGINDPDKLSNKEKYGINY